ncbi:MAG: DNA repair protein RecO [Coriobacteriia bacterium]|nr:DNA repair protein RecO [Coriobacteriia bacterium]
MPSYRVRALALKKTKLGESDLIVTLLSEDGCQVRAVAKGARKPGSRFGARVEPYTVGDFMFSTGRTLDVITDAQTAESHQHIREDYDRAQAASVVADVLDKISVECQTEERLFGLAVATLGALQAADGDDLLALTVAFLVKAMAMHGYRPQFDACPVCGGPVHTSEERFSLEAGGPLCEGCEAGAAETARMTPGARNALVALLGATMAEVPGLRIPRPVLLEAFGLMRAFVGYHLPARCRALDLYAAAVGC